LLLSPYDTSLPTLISVCVQNPATASLNACSPKAKLEKAKLDKHRRVWDCALKAMEERDPHFAADCFTALAVTKNCVGSPHIDTLNVVGDTLELRVYSGW
jgi:hypothetical protein